MKRKIWLTILILIILGTGLAFYSGWRSSQNEKEGAGETPKTFKAIDLEKPPFLED